MSSNQIGFSCTRPSTCFVAITISTGRAAIRCTAGLSASAGLAPVAINRSGHPERLDLDLDPAGAGALVVRAHVAVRKVVDMLTARVLFPLDHATEDLRPAP